MGFIVLSGSYIDVCQELGISEDFYAPQTLEKYRGQIAPDLNRVPYFHQRADLQQELAKTTHLFDDTGTLKDSSKPASYTQGNFYASFFPNVALVTEINRQLLELNLSGTLQASFYKAFSLSYLDDNGTTCGLSIARLYINGQPHFFFSIIRNVNASPHEREVQCFISQKLCPLMPKLTPPAVTDASTLVDKINEAINCSTLNQLLDICLKDNGEGEREASLENFDELMNRSQGGCNFDFYDERKALLDELLGLQLNVKEEQKTPFEDYLKSIRAKSETDPNFFETEKFLNYLNIMETNFFIFVAKEKYLKITIHARIIWLKVFLQDLILIDTDLETIEFIETIIDAFQLLVDALHDELDLDKLNHRLEKLEQICTEAVDAKKRELVSDFNLLITKTQSKLEALQDKQADPLFINYCQALIEAYQNEICNLPDDMRVFSYSTDKTFKNISRPFYHQQSNHALQLISNLNQLPQPDGLSVHPLKRNQLPLSIGLPCLALFITGLALCLSGVLAPLGLALIGWTITSIIFGVGALSAAKIIKDERQYDKECEDYYEKWDNTASAYQDEIEKDSSFNDLCDELAPAACIDETELQTEAAEKIEPHDLQSFISRYTPARNMRVQTPGIREQELGRSDSNIFASFRGGNFSSPALFKAEKRPQEKPDATRYQTLANLMPDGRPRSSSF